MARYYFHIRDHALRIPDDEGLELSGIGAARTEALLSVDDLASANLRSGTINSTMVEIADWRGEVIAALPIRRVLH